MSVFSGKCDLCDHIMGTAGWYDKDGNPIKFGESHSVYYSDEYRDFLEFKKQTGGVLHQHQKIKVTEYNQDEVAKKLPQEFEVITHTTIIPDKRYKSGERTSTTYTYKYWGKEYKSLKELNKHGVYIKTDIHFDTLLDLIPYYPYIVSMASSNDGKQIVYISKESYVISERNEHYNCGMFSDSWQWYNKKLQDHYREIVLRYFNPEGREYIEEITFDENGIGQLANPIDENFEVSWYYEDRKPRDHWTSPEVVDYEKGIIKMHKYDLGKFLGKTNKVYYVKATDYPVYIG